jgi:tetratricopeptide (TPR) repeat protein
MIKKGAVFLVMGILLVVFEFGFAVSASGDSPGVNLQEIDQQLLSLLRMKKYEELDSKIKAYFASCEADFLQEKYLNTAFDTFYRYLPELEPLLNDWISRQPDSYAANLARGIYYTKVGWTKRGSDGAGETTKEQFEGRESYFKKAKKDIDKALSINNRLTGALCYEILILSYFGKGEEIRRLRDKGLAINPHSLTLRMTYISTIRPARGGSMREMKKEIEDARVYFERNPNLKSIQGSTAAERADQMLFADEYAKAIAYYSFALSNGNNSYYNFQRGLAYFLNKQFDLGIKDMDIAIGLRPNNPDAYFWRGYAKHRLQRYTEAVADLSKAIEDDPRNDKAWITRANAYAFLGKADLSSADFEKAVMLWPNDEQHRYGLGQVKKQIEIKNSSLQN